MARKPIKTAARRVARPAPAAEALAPAPAATFYSPAGEAPASPLASHAEAVRQRAIPVENASHTADADLSPHAAPAPTDLHAEIERIRKIRKPLGAYSLKLALPVRRGYHRHWFNDVAGRVSEALANGWSHIQNEDGQSIKRVVGVGRDNGPLYAFAMELPEVFWLEDMAARNEAAQEKVEALKASPFRSAPGAAKPSDSGKFYSPQEDAGPLQVVKGG